MATDFSFDIVSKVDFQEVENALSQARKEIAQRYDFRTARVEIQREKEKITLTAEDEFRLRAAIDVLKGKFVKRGVPLKNIEYGRQETALGGAIRQVLTLRTGINTDKAKEIVKTVKEKKQKVQAAIQADQVRISSRSKDELQSVIHDLQARDFGIELQFTNYR